MDYKEWLDIIGQDAESSEVKEALAKAGVAKGPVLKKDETRKNVQLADAMVIFGAGELFPNHNTGGDGSCLLMGIMLPLRGYKWGEYKGDLPLQLDRANSQVVLRTRFGEPLQTNDHFHWDEWKVDNLLLRVTFTSDRGSLTAVSLKLPEQF